MDLKLLKQPFPEKEIEWRAQSAGLKDGKPWALIMAYCDARSVMKRLDDVCGLENWRVSYREISGGYIARLEIYYNDRWIAKEDAADQTDFEKLKGGISSALKRAAAAWGIGRYLYYVDVAYAVFSVDGKFSTKIEGKYYKFNAPALPAWAKSKE